MESYSSTGQCRQRLVLPHLGQELSDFFAWGTAQALVSYEKENSRCHTQRFLCCHAWYVVALVFAMICVDQVVVVGINVRAPALRFERSLS